MTTDGSSQQSPVTVTVPKNGKLEDLIEALSNACSIGVDEALLVAEVYRHSSFETKAYLFSWLVL